MVKFKLLLKSGLMIFILSLLIALPCQAGQEITPTANPTQTVSLENGLTVILKTNPYSDVVSIVALIKSGSERENKFLGTGITHLTEHMLFKDNPEDPKSEIAKQVSLLGGEIDGATSYDWTQYSITLPKENTIKALELFHRFLMKPEFKKNDLEKEKQVVIKEINLGKDNPSTVLWNKLMETVYVTHPYRYPVIGYENLLKKISLQDLQEYYNANYTPANIILSICGDFDATKVAQKITELFSNDNIGRISPNYKIEEPRQMATRKIVEKIKSTNLGFGSAAYKSVNMRDEDMYALDCLAAILGGSESSRLNQRLKENLKLVYSISTSNFTPMEPGIFVTTFRSETDNIEDAFQEIASEIEKIKKTGVSEEELNIAKQSVRSSFLFSQESCESIAGLNAQFEWLTGDPDFNSLYLEKIEKLTPNDIKTAAIKYLVPSSLTIVSLIPEKEAVKKEQAQKETSSKPEIKKYVLDGGLRLLIREDKQLPIVDVKIIFLGGILGETKKDNGISFLTSQLVLKGTKTKSALTIARIFESWGANVDAFSNNNSFGISLKILKENFPDALKLLAQIINDPAFDEQEIEKEKSVISGLLKQQKESIFTIGSLLLRKELYQGHPYSFNPLGSPETLKNLDQKQISEFYRKMLNKPNMVISVFGDIDAQNTVNLVSSCFSGISSKNTSSINVEKPRPLNRSNSIFQVLDKEQSIFILGFRTCSLRNKDRYALDIVSEALSGLDGRLFRDIRKELGIAYALGGYNTDQLQDGHFIFYVATTKENLRKAQEKIWQEVKSLKEYSLTSEELDRAKKSIIGKQKIGLETNSGLAVRAASDELYGLGFNNYKNFENDINNISREKIKQVLNKYFTSNYAEVFISPSSFVLESSGDTFSLKKLFGFPD